MLSGTDPLLSPYYERAMDEIQAKIRATTPSGPVIIDKFFPSFTAKVFGETLIVWEAELYLYVLLSTIKKDVLVTTG